MCPCVDYLLWATIDTILLIKPAEDDGEPDAQPLAGLNFVTKFDSCGTVS